VVDCLLARENALVKSVRGAFEKGAADDAASAHVRDAVAHSDRLFNAFDLRVCLEEAAGKDDDLARCLFDLVHVQLESSWRVGFNLGYD